jgi:hypothetical protein
MVKFSARSHAGIFGCVEESAVFARQNDCWHNKLDSEFQPGSNGATLLSEEKAICTMQRIIQRNYRL